MTRRWVRTFERRHTKNFVRDKPNDRNKSLCCVVVTGAYLRSDLCSLLGIHHADVFEVFEGVLPVLLLGAHVLLQQGEDVARLREDRRGRWLGSEREQGDSKRSANHRTPPPPNR